MIDQPSLAAALSKLSGRFSGELLRDGDPPYDEARRVHNGLIDRRPAVIARCRGTADVVEAVRLSRELGLEVAVRGGGHNPAGRATVDGGLMIDLSPMRGIHVDPRVRAVRAQGGVTWGTFDRETQLHGLATTGGTVSSTGIAGLTLGGGLGWLMGKHGLSSDNLLSAEIVTADGRVVTASAQENPDLFWGIRGGGGNFGVATWFEYRLHPVGPTVIAGPLMHPFERVREVLAFFRDAASSIPEELGLMAGLLHGPDGSALAAIVAVHGGSLADGEAATRGLKAFGSPVLDGIGPMPYGAANTIFDAAFPRGAMSYWKSSFLEGLSDDAIEALRECYARCPAPMSMIAIERMHGAVTRVPVGETAFPHRRAGYNLLILGEWTDPADTDRCIRWGREAYAAMGPFMAAGRYVNYLDQDDGADSVAAAYGPNYPRLRELKAKFDPDNWFHLNQNIRPAR
jgi:FAD/FMN-containing dehydrogenase